ncbi:MAG: HAMP domain-containing sensor histidine kinase [Acidimicrobiia bacterium]
MATRLTQSLLGADADMHRIHRRVVRVGAAVSGIAAAFFLISGFLAGNEAMYLEAVGPTLVAAFMTAQIVLNRENGGVALFGAAVVTVVMYAVVGNQDTLIPAAVALVIIPAIGTLFLDGHRVVSVVSVSFLLLVTPFIWGLGFGEAATLGVVMAVSFALTAVVFITIRSSAAALNVRFQTLFENSPTAVMEEDWSESIAYVRSEYSGRPDRIRPFLMAYPAVVKRAVARAKVIRLNQAAIDLLEADGPEDLLGYRSPGAVVPETMEIYVGALVSLYEGKRFFEQEAPARTVKGRSIWLQTRSVDTSTGLPASNILIGLADITHIKARNDAMAELVKSKDEFIARVSHELRTPLTAVVGLTSELNALENLAPEERKELMGLVAGQAEEMAYIVDDLLVAARAEMGTVAIDTVEVDLGSQLRATIEGLGVGVSDVPEMIHNVVADPSRVRQVLRNLMTNAVRYGGPHIRVTTGSAGGRVWIEVRDNGEGVPAEESQRIFEPYATAHSGVAGSVGLGLSVSRQLAELMGGTLTYHRDINESVFHFELPLAGDPRPVAAFNKAAV